MKDPFELIGQSILLMLSNDAFCQIYTLGVPVRGIEDGIWIVSGKVAADVPGVGLWVSIREISSPRGKTARSGPS